MRVWGLGCDLGVEKRDSAMSGSGVCVWAGGLIAINMTPVILDYAKLFLSDLLCRAIRKVSVDVSPVNDAYTT